MDSFSVRKIENFTSRIQVLDFSLRAIHYSVCKIINPIRSVVKRCGELGDITYLQSKIVRNLCDNKIRELTINQRFSMASKDYLPYYASGKVVSGFGRGSKSLGCPTANFSEEVVEALPAEFETGIYFGWACLNKIIYKMVMSIGWNPFYKNDKKSMEIHLIHKFENDFYGEELKVIVLGYVRPELNFSSVDELIKAIQNDIEIAKKSLDEPSMVKYKEDPFLNC